jgi:RNA polymerase sigma factor (sigma-70 family)
MIDVLTRLKITLAPEVPPSVTDAELVDRFVRDSDHEAFAEIVRRHGSMVFGVCRRALAHHQDAEDAFQAVFLVLAQKGHTVRSSVHLSSWLYTVACRTAGKARSVLSSRRAREAPLDGHGFATCDPSPESVEWHKLLDEEVERLPEKYRLPVLLSELLGLTRSETARQLGCPEGTVAGRLHRAKQLLANRLRARGVAFSLPLLAPWFLSGSAGAAVSVRLLASTVRLATISALGAAGAGVIPSTVSCLSQGVISTMSTSLTKLTAGIGMVVLSVGTLYLGSTFAQSQPAQKPGSTGGNPGVSNPLPEPIHPRIVLQKPVQEELRLSQSQVDKLYDAWEAGKAKAGDAVKERDRVKGEIAELEKQLSALHEKEQSLVRSIEKSQEESLREAIRENLSRQAIERIRQLSLQELSLRTLLNNPRIRAELKVTDEQLKKLEEVWAISRVDVRYTQAVRFLARLEQPTKQPTELLLFMDASGASNEEIMKVLTPEQQRQWKEMIGKPFPSAESDKKD